VSGGKDLDKAEDELREAEKRGFRIGRREKAFLAEGFRSRGEEWLRDIPRLPGKQQQQDYLEKADGDFARAEDFYRDIVPYGNSITMLRRIYLDRDTVSQTRQRLKDQSAWP
jgi:hypothetical protein